MQQHRPPVEAVPAAAGAWYRQPVLWLGALILAASLAGCIFTIVVSSRHADQPLELDRQPHTLLDMPVHRAEPASGAVPATGAAGAAPATRADAAPAMP